MSIGFFFFSLATPVFYVQDFPSDVGLTILFLGWIGIFDGVFGWFANIFYAVAIILFLSGKKRFAFAISILGALVALDSFRIRYTYHGDASGTPFQSAYDITAYGVGFYFWLSAMCLLPIGIYFSKDFTHKKLA